MRARGAALKTTQRQSVLLTCRPPAPVRILVTGGTGTLGRLVVPRLRAAGGDIRVLSRQSLPDTEGVEYATGDLAVGEGIEAAVAGAEGSSTAPGTSKGDEDKAVHLIRAAARAGAAHVVFISVVGADRIPIASHLDRAMFGYFETKLAAENVVAESGLPWTTLRATLRGRPPERGTARTWPRTEPSAAVRGRSSSPTASARSGTDRSGALATG